MEDLTIEEKLELIKLDIMYTNIRKMDVYTLSSELSRCIREVFKINKEIEKSIFGDYFTAKPFYDDLKMIDDICEHQALIIKKKAYQQYFMLIKQELQNKEEKEKNNG